MTNQQDGAQAPTDAPAEFEAAFAEFAAPSGPPGSDGHTVAEGSPVEEPPPEPPADDASVPPPTQPEGAGQPAGDDIWSSVPEAARAEFHTTQQRLRDAQAQRDAIAGRLGSRIQHLERQLAAIGPTKTAEPSAKDDADNPPADDALKTLVEEYPEVGRPVASLIQRLQAKIDELSAPVARFSQREAEAAEVAEEQALNSLVPDWQNDVYERDSTGRFVLDRDGNTVPSQAFRSWLQQQPGYVVEAIKRNSTTIVDHREAADIIGRFRATLQPATPPTSAAPSGKPGAPANLAARRERQLASATAVSSRSPGSGGSGPPDDFDTAFNYYAKRAARS